MIPVIFLWKFCQIITQKQRKTAHFKETSGLTCRVSTEKMHSFRIHLNQFIGDMPALCYEYPVKVLPHPFFW